MQKSVFQLAKLYFSNPHSFKIMSYILRYIREKDSISMEKTIEFLQQTKNTKKHTTYLTYYKYISSFLNYLYKKKILDFSMDDLNYPKPKDDIHLAPSLHKRIEKQQVLKLIELLHQSPDPRHPLYSLFVELLMHTGLRMFEAMKLSFLNQDVLNHESGFVLVYLIGKSEKGRTVYIPETLFTRIQNLYSPYPFKNLPYPTNFLKRFCLKQGLTPITPHQIRSFYGTYLLEHNQVELNLVAQLLGHSNIQTTARYYLRNKLNFTKLNII